MMMPLNLMMPTSLQKFEQMSLFRIFIRRSTQNATNTHIFSLKVSLDEIFWFTPLHCSHKLICRLQERRSASPTIGARMETIYLRQQSHQERPNPLHDSRRGWESLVRNG